MDDPLINAMVIISVVGMIILIILVITVNRAEAKRRMALDLHGRTVTATITSVRGDDLGGYSATAEWSNPQTGAISTFKGSSPGYREGESVEVVFDPHNPHKCYFRR